MTPILENGIAGFVTERDLTVAEGALVANMKLIEGVAATYPDDRRFLEMSAMARANYAFGFIEDELQAVRITYPGDDLRSAPLLDRVSANYAVGRAFAERALAMNGGYADKIDGRALELISLAELQSALAELDTEDAEALFWLAFNWGGAMQAHLSPTEATQLPKVEIIAKRVLELDDTVFFGIGPHMMVGVFYGFRAPALGGNPELARKHLALARERSGSQLPDVLEAQFVDAQTENLEGFKKRLRQVIAAELHESTPVFDLLAKRKACRLLANIDSYFLTDAQPVPDACMKVQQKHPLREEPLEAAPAGEDDA